MKSLPQIRLRTVFLIIFCAAVGMTCATAPKAEDDPSLKLFGFHVAQLNLHYAFLSAAAMAMVIGLTQQARMLARWQLPESVNNDDLFFARSIAICWRAIVAIIIGVCLVARILILRRVINLPEHENFYPSEIFPDTLLLMSVILVLTDSIRRWQRKNLKPQSGWIALLGSVCGFVLALLILPDSGLIHFLVHVATQGIELAAPLKFQRVGAFPTHQAEHFQLFWLSLGAVIAVVMVASGLALAKNIEFMTKGFIAVIAASFTLLATSAAFCIWFYSAAFYHVSPDLASVGFASNWLDWLGGGTLIAILTTAGAYRLAIGKASATMCAPDDGGPANQVALHESVLCLVFLFGTALVYFVETIRQFVNEPFFARSTIWETIATVLSYPPTYIMLAVSVLSLQLCWARWTRRHEAVIWELKAIDQRRFLWNWFALALLAVVALPTFSIYCFTFWMGPWYLYGS